MQLCMNLKAVTLHSQNPTAGNACHNQDKGSPTINKNEPITAAGLLQVLVSSPPPGQDVTLQK